MHAYRLLPVLAAAAALYSGNTRADDAATADVFTLGTVEVIGEKLPDAAAVTTDSIDASTLAARHRDDLSTALDLVPGVAIQEAGQRRERTVAVRGFTSREVPLFIDGVPVYVPYDGVVDLGRFGVDYVSQIIVSKGLASLLYGPNTLGGAINVVSRRPSQPFEAHARLETELDDHFDDIEQRVSASLGGVHGAWYANANVSYTNADGYRLPHDFTPTTAEDGGKRNNADSRDTVISAKIGYAPNAGNEFALSYYRQDGSKDDPPYAGTSSSVKPRYWQWPYWDKQSVYFVARNAIAAQGTLRWRLYYDSFKNALESYDDDTYTTQTRPYAFHGSHYDDYSVGGSADFEWRWTAQQTTRIAAHYRNDVHREAEESPYAPQERLDIPTYDIAIEHEWWVLPTLSLTPGYSHMVQPGRTVHVYNDDDEPIVPVRVDSADADNAQLVAAWHVTTQQTVYAGISRKTRFPTLKERFSGGLGTVVPNPSLDPESAMHYEIGYEAKTGSLHTKIALYESRLHDAIEAVNVDASLCATDSSDCTQEQNIGRQRNRGIEASADWSPLATLLLNAQLDIVDVDNLSDSSLKSTGTPEFKYQLGADWQFMPQWRLRADLDHESKRYSDTAGDRIAGAFTLANAFVRYEPLPQLGIEIGGRNLSDARYAYEEGFYQAGRTWLAQVDYRY
ncbi:TonB-dependent receptor [Solimonas sp. C16B3]|uniref:TonB-dependent receptor n=1 Tax=Solimonas marina TaxID=2714601 RepID=A0A969WAN5_9GAMM|nr:TonB-dependent receptor [Solimonas marina]